MLSFSHRPPLQGGLLEAAYSLIQELAFGSVSWAYAGQPFALLGGRTSLLYMEFVDEATS